jgi:hypothetical protein
MTFAVLLNINGPYGPNKVGKGDPLGATLVAQPTGKTGPGLLQNIGGLSALFNGPFGHETRRKIPIHLGQRTGPCALSALNTMKDPIFFNELE